MKKQMTRLTAIVLAAAMTFSLAGCQAKGASQSTAATQTESETQTAETTASDTKEAETKAPETKVPETSTEAAAAASEETKDAFPVTITDQAGRSITIEAKPEKIVSGYYITTSLMIALGLKDQVVGIEAKAKSRPIYALSAPGFLDLPNVGSAKEFNLEGCAALKPDLVIVPLKLKESAQALEELGLKVLLVNPEDKELLEETIRIVGQATGTSERAEALISYNENKTAKLAETLKNVEKPTVYLAGNSSMLSTAGPKMYQNTLIENGGGVNAAAELEDTYWAEVSYEQILAWNPEMIVVVPGAGYTVEDVLKDEQLAGVKAVENKAVYQMPADFEAWDSPVPSAVLGSLWMASALHGDVYTEETFQADVKDFYKQFYDVEIDTSLLSK